MTRTAKKLTEKQLIEKLVSANLRRELKWTREDRDNRGRRLQGAEKVTERRVVSAYSLPESLRQELRVLGRLKFTQVEIVLQDNGDIWTYAVRRASA